MALRQKVWGPILLDTDVPIENLSMTEVLH